MGHLKILVYTYLMSKLVCCSSLFSQGNHALVRWSSFMALDKPSESRRLIHHNSAFLLDFISYIPNFIADWADCWIILLDILHKIPFSILSGKSPRPASNQTWVAGKSRTSSWFSHEELHFDQRVSSLLCLTTGGHRIPMNPTCHYTHYQSICLSICTCLPVYLITYLPIHGSFLTI